MADIEQQQQQTYLSDEQRNIVDHLVVSGGNAVCNAVAGSGKTTLIVAIAKELSQKGKRCLILTYNARLKSEVRMKTISLGTTVVAHNFHSAASFFLKSLRGNDLDLHASLSRPPIHPLSFDAILVDEAQDLTPLFRDFLIHIINSNNTVASILLVGDVFQLLYAYNGASFDYIANVGWLQKLDRVNKQPFTMFRLSISWRISHEMAEFINTNLNPLAMRCFIRDDLHNDFKKWWDDHEASYRAAWGDGIHASPYRLPDSDSVVILSDSGCRYNREIKKWIPDPKSKIKTHVDKIISEYGNTGIVLLSTSVRSNTPLSGYVNATCAMNDENWLVLDDEGGECNIDPCLWKEKRVASTVHRFKGLERDGVIFFDLQDYYLNLTKKKILQDGYGNIELLMAEYSKMYVACTRARKRLVVVMGTFPTLSKIVSPSPSPSPSSPLQNHELTSISVSDLIRHVPFDTGLQCEGVLWRRQFREDLSSITKIVKKIPTICMVPGRGGITVEDVSHILGTAIGYAIWEFFHAEKLQIFLKNVCNFHTSNHVNCHITQCVTDAKSSIIEYMNLLVSSRTPTWKERVRLTVAIYSITSPFVHLWFQLDSTYDWVDDEFMEMCVGNAKNMLINIAQINNIAMLAADRIQFEVDVSRTFYLRGKNNHSPVLLRGRIDAIIDDRVIIEFKVSSMNESYQHAFQTACYLALRMLDLNNTAPPKALLLNCTFGTAFDISLVHNHRSGVHSFLCHALQCKLRRICLPLEEEPKPREIIRTLTFKPEVKHPHRYTNEQFEIIQTNDFQKWFAGINPFTQKKIKIGGNTHRECGRKMGLTLTFTEYKKIMNLDKTQYIEESKHLDEETKKENERIQKYNNQLSELVIKLQTLKWNEYIEFDDELYGVAQILGNIHKENDCNGELIFMKEESISCGCHLCENWGGCRYSRNGRSFRKLYKCDKCNYETDKYTRDSFYPLHPGG